MKIKLTRISKAMVISRLSRNKIMKRVSIKTAKVGINKATLMSEIPHQRVKVAMQRTKILTLKMRLNPLNNLRNKSSRTAPNSLFKGKPVNSPMKKKNNNSE